jgi:Asp-tRNA(Asn)/Glu-tRNA(Gln) amidotransferase C subunit
LVAVALSVGLALGFVPAYSQVATGSSSGVASVSFNHFYIITSYGFGVLNDSFTFKNNGTSSVQIPTLQVGLPSKIASRTFGLVLSPSDQFSVSQSQGIGTTIVTIAPNQPTLGAGASSTVALKAVLNNILNYSNGVYANAAHSLVLLSPSLNVNVTQMKSTIILPTGGLFTQAPAGFAAPAANATSPQYTMTQTGVQPQASARYLNFTDNNQSAFTPITVNSLVRTIVPAANGTPMVEDEFSIHNIAAYSIAQIRLYLLYPGLQRVTVIPNTLPPLLNRQVVPLGSGMLAFASTSIAAPLLPNSNASFTLSYPLPSTMMAVTGNSVKLTIPYSPLIAAPVSNYTIMLAPSKGIVTSGATSVLNKQVTPFTPGDAVFTYSVSVGWAADQAVPAAALIFAVAFAMFAIQKPASEEEEGEKIVRSMSDVLKSFEEKTGLETQDMNELASATKGSISKAEFERMRNEVSDLRGRAVQRLTEMKQDLGSGKQFDLLTRVAEAEKEEDRAFRDLLNLYLQYHGNRMNEETFKRLQPNYRKRVESAVNRLSDLLHETQTEEK